MAVSSKQFSIVISTDIQGLPVDYGIDVKSPDSTTGISRKIGKLNKNSISLKSNFFVGRGGRTQKTDCC